MTNPPGSKPRLSPPPDPYERPPTRFAVPPGAVDAHAHLVGDGVRQPYVSDRSFTPVPAPPQDYLTMLDATDMTYGVLVQVSAHGTDNSLMVDALKANPDRLRGIAVAPYDLPEKDLADLKEAGVTGLRLNIVSGGGIGLSHLDDYEKLCEEMDWHLQFLAPASQLEPIASRLSTLRVPYVIDNMGWFDVGAGVEASGWQQLLKLLADGAWVKLDGVYRVSETPPYPDALPFAQSLIDAAPQRCVWGSDWPHVGFWGPMPNGGDLLDVLADWAPDPARRNAILADNPHTLYGFAAEVNDNE